MADKPDQLPQWAELDQVDSVSQQNNVLVPPPEKQNYGWARLEFPPRNWFNWLGRYTYRWLRWFDQQESQSVVTDGNGTLLFTTENALIEIVAIDTTNPDNYLRAVGYKAAGSAPVFATGSIDANVLGLGSGTITGDQPITGGTAGDIIVYGQSKIIP